MPNSFDVEIDDVNGVITGVYGGISGLTQHFRVSGAGFSIGAIGITESVEVYNAYQSGVPGAVVVQSAGWVGGLGGAWLGVKVGVAAGGVLTGGNPLGAFVGGAVGAYYGGQYGEEKLEEFAEFIQSVNFSYDSSVFPDLPSQGDFIRGLSNFETFILQRFGHLSSDWKHCFSRDVVIAKQNGETVTICSIRPGDTVVSFDPLTGNGRGALVPKKVARTFTNITEEWLRLTWVEDGEEKELVTTPGHEFLTAHGGFRQIEKLMAGGQGTLVLADGSEAVVMHAAMAGCNKLIWAEIGLLKTTDNQAND